MVGASGVDEMLLTACLGSHRVQAVTLYFLHQFGRVLGRNGQVLHTLII